MNDALIVRDDGRLTVEFTARAIELKEDALDLAAAIRQVTNAEENAAAVAAQTALRVVSQQVEEARKLAKAPVLEFGRMIDDTAKRFLGAVEREQLRIAKPVADFQALELQRQRAEEAAKRKELEEIDRKRQEEIAKAAAVSHEAVEQVQAKFDTIAAAVKETPVHAPARATGQIVKEVWVIDQIREHELARARPDLIRKFEFDLLMLKAALEATNGKVPGVTAHKEPQATVRVGRQQVIEIGGAAA